MATSTKANEAKVSCNPNDTEKLLVIFDEESSGNRHYCKGKGLIEIVQTGKNDTISVHYTGPDTPSKLDITQGGNKKNSTPASSKAGGSLYSVDVTYISPTVEDYKKNKQLFLNKLLTYNLAPTQYSITNLPEFIIIKAYCPDQWELTFKLPPFKGYKAGIQYDNNLDSNIEIKKHKIVEKKDVKTSFKIEEEKTHWKTTTKESLSASYQGYSQKISTPTLYASTSIESQSTKYEYEKENKSLLNTGAISLKCNGQIFNYDLIKIALGAINLVVQFTKTIKEFKDFVPKVGWYIDYEFNVLQGDLILSWGWREDKDCKAYYYVGFYADLKIFDLSLEIGFGVELTKFMVTIVGQVCVQLKGSLSVKAGIERKAPSEIATDHDKAKVTLAKPSLTIEAGVYVRFQAGKAITIVGGINSSITFEGAFEFSISDGPTLSGDTKWNGLTLKLKAEIMGFEAPKDFTLMNEKKLGSIKFPEEKEVKQNDLTRIEVHSIVEETITDGWNLRVKHEWEEYIPAEKGFIWDTPAHNETKSLWLEPSEIADIISERIYQERNRLLLDQKTTNGLAHTVRKQCDIMAERAYKRDFLTLDELNNYLNGDTFSYHVKQAMDPAERYKAELRGEKL